MSEVQSLFTILQPSGPLTEVRLTRGNFGVCSARRTAAVDAKPKPKQVRRLWGSGSGQFRTRGRYGSATVRGTIWLVVDRCDGTLVRVTRGRVAVNDFGRRRQVIVRAGKSYLARAPNR